MKIIFFANTDWYLFNFRLALIEAVRDLGHEILLVSPPGLYGERLKSEGFRWVSIDMNRRSLNPFSEIRVLKDLVVLYKNESPDIVHHFTIKCVVYGSIASYFAGIVPKVNAVAGLGYVFTNNNLLAKTLRPFVQGILRLVLRGNKAKLILQNPDDVQEFLSHKLVDPRKIVLIRGSGVNTNRFKPVNKKIHGRVRVLLATRLLWDKGVGEYVKAATILNEGEKNIDFILAGSSDEGNPAAVTENDICKWKKEGIVDCIGHVEDMATLLKDVDLVVLPSYREGTPKILLEAAAMGLPIVATDVPGCREIVSHGVNGLLVPCKNAQALAVAIQSLVIDPQKRSQMGCAGRKKVLAEFDECLVVSRTIEIYDKLLSS